MEGNLWDGNRQRGAKRRSCEQRGAHGGRRGLGSLSQRSSVPKKRWGGWEEDEDEEELLPLCCFGAGSSSAPLFANTAQVPWVLASVLERIFVLVILGIAELSKEQASPFGG